MEIIGEGGVLIGIRAMQRDIRGVETEKVLAV